MAGGHSGVSDDHRKRQYIEAMPAHLDNSPAPTYTPCGITEPAGIGRHGMYGTAPRPSARAAPLTAPTRPLPGPAALGQYDNDDMRPIAPSSDLQYLEVLDERTAEWVDPGTVRADLTPGTCVLSGIVRDAETKARIARIAQACMPSRKIHNALELMQTDA